MGANIEGKFSSSVAVPGASPIVVIGANGAGKTRLGAGLVRQN